MIVVRRGDVFISKIAQKMIAVVWANNDTGYTKIETEDGEERIIQIDSIRRRYSC